MAKLNLLPSLVTQIAGGAGASTLDRMKPEWTLNVGGQHTGFGLPDLDPASVQLPPGLLGALALTAVVALMPGSSDATWKSILANLAGGGLVYEGVKLAETEILPRLDGSKPLPGAAAQTHGMHGMPQMMRGAFAPYAMRGGYNQFQVQQAMRGFARAA